jgi:hypothetical protein
MCRNVLKLNIRKLFQRHYELNDCAQCFLGNLKRTSETRTILKMMFCSLDNYIHPTRKLIDNLDATTYSSLKIISQRTGYKLRNFSSVFWNYVWIFYGFEAGRLVRIFSKFRGARLAKWGLIHCREKYFSLFHKFQTGSCLHVSSYSKDLNDFYFLRMKRTEREGVYSPQCSAKFKTVS